MGLDVYLYRCSDKAAAKASTERFEAECEKLRNEKFEGKWSYQLSRERADDWKKEELAIANRCGTNTNGESVLIEQIEKDSLVDAEHYFKIGYLRSSYNSSGFNSVMRKRGLPDLYNIFENKDEYEFVPDWEKSLNRCNEAIDTFTQFLESPEAKYDVIAASANPFCKPEELASTEKDAISRFLSESNKASTSEYKSFGNKDGEFFLDGLKVVAAISGTETSIFGNGLRHVTYMVYEHDPLKQLGWYLNALKIVRETIEYVINHPTPDQFYFHWST